MEKTDSEHGLTLVQITDELRAYDINADRKTLYMDFEDFRSVGMDIIKEKRNKQTVYYLASRDFELAELKLLVDSVQASRFITARKSSELIRKIESLVSEHEAKELQRQVILSGRVKNMNESIYYSVDKLHAAINAGKQISFLYYHWTPQKKKEYRKGDARYIVSPWNLMWDDENYYLIAYNAESDDIRHYRVDKMERIEMLDAPREGKEKFRKYDLPSYSKSLFGMFGGKAEKVSLYCENDMAGVIIDRFGKDTVMYEEDEEHFTAVVNVVPSMQFLGWIIGLGGGIRISGPTAVVDKMKALVEKQAEMYEG